MYKIIIISAVLLVSSYIAAQSHLDEVYEEVQKPKKQAGITFTMAETGSGFGGFIGWPLIKNYHFGFSLDVLFIRDSGEITYYDYYGYPRRINRENNVYLFDFLITMKRRLFASDFEDSFRPFFTAAFGYVYGMNYPEFDTTPDGNPTSDQFRRTLGGFFGIGADISTSNMFYLGVRAQYRIMSFSKILGETSNHSMFEFRFELGRRF